ncbi:MAG: DUF1365 family protein [Rickettsiales bacterium]|jgi:DUF1365 family protein
MEKIIEKPLLIKGDISHQRFFPKKNNFNYKSTYISFPISKIVKLGNSLLSIDKFNLFGFYASDYGDKNSQNIKGWIEDILQKNNISGIKETVLVTHPRILGYAFNPVSFWLCLDGSNKLIAVLSEVSNTCGQKHNYLCFKEGLEPIKSSEWIEAKKEFYVSPFMEIEGKYKFRFEIEENKMNFFINYLVDGKLKLSTSLKCHLKELNNRNLLTSFLKIPFATFKTVILIHYQALKLYFKSIKYYPYPKKLDKNLTISKIEK